jgi:uncharacterized protein YdeI (YjbR/CyaY-like superfamily)
MPEDTPILEMESPRSWEKWLSKNYAVQSGVWLKIAKKGAVKTTIDHDEAVEVALMYGWIDGQGRSLDESFWLQRFTPRRRRSRWSKINRARAEALIAEGRMKESGMCEVEAAKADGRWDAAYDSPANATVPDDLKKALAKHKKAAAFFASLDSRNRYAILYRVHDAKKPETRARRIEQFVNMLKDGKKLY